ASRRRRRPRAQGGGRAGTGSEQRTRRTRRRGPGPARRSREGLRGLLDVLLVGLADGNQLIHRLEVVDEQLALEMVQLVLERAGEEAGARHLDLLAVPVLGDDPHLLAAGSARG